MKCPKCGGKAAADTFDIQLQRVVYACFSCDWESSDQWTPQEKAISRRRLAAIKEQDR